MRKGPLQQWRSKCRKHAVRSVFHTTHTRVTAATSSQHKVTTEKKQFHVMMKSQFYLIIRIRLHILWYSMMHCRRGERWHNGQSQVVIVSGPVETKFRGWIWSSKNNKRHCKKSSGLIKTQTAKIITKAGKKNKKINQFLVISQHHNKQTHECFFVSKLFIWTHSEPGNKTKHAVHVWLHVYAVGSYGTGFYINKRHKQKAVISRPNGLEWLPWMSGPYFNSFNM